MVAYLRSRSQKFPIALIAGLAVAALVAAVVLALPATALSQIVDTLALGDVVTAGETTRLALALAAGVALGAIVWAILVLTVGTHIVLHAWHSDTPVLRPSDSHPDAPARAPIRAAEELGPPLETEAPEQAVPADLDQPLAAFDPVAIPAAPREPVRPVAPLVRAERIETFELTPLVRNRPEPQPSLASLLDRLERGAAQNPPRAARSLEAALSALRDSPI